MSLWFSFCANLGDKKPTVDHIVAYGQSIILEEALKKANVPVTMHTVGESDHVFIGATKEEIAALDAATDEFVFSILG